MSECVRNARDSVRRILSVSSSSNRGRKKLRDEPRSGAGRRPPLLPRLRRMVCGVARPPPNHLHPSARPHVLRAPRPPARRNCLVAEARAADGVPVNRPRPRCLRQVVPLLRRVRPKSQEGRRTRMTGSRLRKTSGSPQDCGISNESIGIRSLLCHF